MGKPRMSSAVITPDDLKTTVSSALRRSNQWTRNAADALAGRFGWSKRKAEAHLYGDGSLTAVDLANLLATDDVVFDEVMRLIGRDRPLTDETKREILKLLEHA